MKKLNHRSFLSIALLFIFFLSTNAQGIKGEETIPLNPDIRYGKLENGLTYYIMKNSEPQDKVELRLVINAGSILEDDNQLGLAHFMEHMNFNGTKNFEKNELVDYLQSVGVKFGAHLNAYTSFDETVYMLTLPVDDQEVVNKGFQVLEDWAHNALLTDEEIDKERGVVLEEYRMGLGASKRMLNNYLPKLLYGSKYAERIPIGTPEVLENFKYETIRKFYNDWYRPDLMAVVVVGDIDPQAMEKQITDHFSGINNPVNERPREVYTVPNHEETFVAIESDKENPYTQVQVIFKDPKPVEEEKTIKGYRKLLTTSMFTSMLNSRLEEIRNTANPPFSYAGGGYGSFAARTKNAFQMYAVVPETGQLTGLEALLTEAQRIKQHGFTEGELDRVKKNMLAYIERAYNERDKSQSANHAAEIIRNFLQQEPVPGIIWEYEKYQVLIPAIEIKEVNALINTFISDQNRMVILLGTEKEGIEKVSEESVREVLENADNMSVDPYQEEEIASSLMETLPQAGKIVSNEINDEQGFKTITLENGMKVSYKATDFKNDQIVMRGYSYGGTSTYTDEEYLKTNLASRVMFTSGIGDFTEVDLTKVLAGKVVGVNPFISDTEEGFGGSATPKDLESMFQLIHLYFTSPRKDQEAFDSYVARTKSIYSNINSNPQAYFQIEHGKFLSQNDVRAFKVPSDEDWDNTDYDLIVKKYEEGFSNPGDFNLFFVGNISEEEFLELAKTYLASIPGNGRKDQVIDRGVRQPEGIHEKIYKKGIDQKSYVTIDFEGEAKFNRVDQYRLSILGEVLKIKLTELLREDKGGVYTVSASGSLRVTPFPRYTFSISFPCDPENAMDLKEAALAELNLLLKEGPTEKDLNKVKEEKRKSLKEALRTNGFWVNKMYGDSYTQGASYTEAELYQRIEDLNSKNIRKVGKKYLTDDYVIGILMPEGM